MTTKDSSTTAYDAINIYYKGYLSEMGGIETVTYNIAYKYRNKNIVFLLNGAHPNQIKRLMEIGAYVSPYEKGRTYHCKRCFVTSEGPVPENIIAEEYIRVGHATPEDLMQWGWKLPKDMAKTKNYGVSRLVCESTERISGEKCTYCPNPYIEEKTRPVLKLISPQRMTWEKGLPLMQKMAKELDEHNIPFIWLVACDRLEDVVKLNNPSFVFLKSRLDIKNYIKEADYLVLLSNTEGSPMAPQEALQMGVPIIVTHIPWVDDLNIDENYGFFLDLDLKNLDVEEIYKKKGTFKFSFEPPKDFWGDLLADGKMEVNLPKMKVCIVKARKEATERGGIFIAEAGGIPEEGQEFEVLEPRVAELQNSNYGRLVELVRYVDEQLPMEMGLPGDISKTTKPVKKARKKS